MIIGMIKEIFKIYKITINISPINPDNNKKAKTIINLFFIYKIT